MQFSTGYMKLIHAIQSSFVVLFLTLILVGCGGNRLSGYSAPVTPPQSNGEALGKITRFDSNGNLEGLVCQLNANGGVNLQIYTGNEAAANGILLQETKAILTSDTTDAFFIAQCASVGTVYSFSIPFSVLQPRAGVNVYVYAKSLKSPGQLIKLENSGIIIPDMLATTTTTTMVRFTATTQPQVAPTTTTIRTSTTTTTIASTTTTSTIPPTTSTVAITTTTIPVTTTTLPPVAPTTTTQSPVAPTTTTHPAVVATTTTTTIPIMYSLVVSNSDSQATVTDGAINCGSHCTASVAKGSSVKLQANVPAASGWLAIWQGCDSVLDNQCTVNMNANKNVSVEFIQPVYRRHHPTADDWLYSLSKTEASASYTQGGVVVFYLYRSIQNGRAPLNRCLIPGKQHFLSNTDNCEGHKKEMTLGYVASAQSSANILIQLKRYYKLPTGARHFTGTSVQTPPGGYIFEGPQGFVPK
jgi:hypothetical protein